MMDLVVEAKRIADEISELMASGDVASSREKLERLEAEAKTVGRSASGSWLGYHAYIYYADLLPPPPGHHFNAEFGFIQLQTIRTTSGDWQQYDPEEVADEIYQRGGLKGPKEVEGLIAGATKLLKQVLQALRSITALASKHHDDSVISDIHGRIQKASVPSANSIAHKMQPGSLVSRDSTALSQGWRVPPHIQVQVAAMGGLAVFRMLENLREEAEGLASHLERMSHLRSERRVAGSHVFIGHGRSPAWRELEGFIRGRLHLEPDEFNRVSTAGVTNVARLSEMLDAAGFAFFIMTAEDEQADGTKRARQNVIHEAGLFQGRLGFSKAIVLLEEGCEDFSNIAGLVHIPFPPGRISAAFEDIRRVLEREGLLEGHGR